MLNEEMHRVSEAGGAEASLELCHKAVQFLWWLAY